MISLGSAYHQRATERAFQRFGDRFDYTHSYRSYKSLIDPLLETPGAADLHHAESIPNHCGCRYCLRERIESLERELNRDVAKDHSTNENVVATKKSESIRIRT